MPKQKVSLRKRTRALGKTLLKAHRFNAQLFTTFEDECIRNLQSPKMVLEALIDHWLAADAKQRAAIAERRRQNRR